VSLAGVNLPNLITLGRLVLAPVAVWLIITGQIAGAFWLFVAAGVSDAADGLLARWLQARTLIGSYLDPIADKVLLVGVYFALGYRELLPIWLIVLVVSRDLLILGWVILMHMLRPQAGPLKPLYISKINTVAQICLAGVTLAVGGFELDAQWPVVVLIWTVAATTLLSWVGYFQQALRAIGSIEGH
jgi:cardiolipin synthase (CMP-forming)